MATHYISSVDYAALTQWAASTAYTVGAIRRPLTTPAAGKELAYRCTTAGTSGTTEPVWPTTAGGTVTDGTAVWTEVTTNATYNNASWATAPYGTLMAASNLAPSGLGTPADDFYLGHDHVETYSANATINIQGYTYNSSKYCAHVYCVNRAGSFPPVNADLRTTAQITTTGAATLTVQGLFYCYGVKWSCGSGANGPVFRVNANWTDFESCNFNLAATNQQSLSFISGFTRLRNCTFTYGNAGDNTALEHTSIVEGPVGTPIVTGPTIPSYWITQAVTDELWTIRVTGADFSNFVAGTNYVADLKAQANTLFRDCKVPTGTLCTASGGMGNSNLSVRFEGCNSAGNVERNEIYSIVCNLFTETTIIPSGGASDGTTAYSWKLVPQNNGNFRDCPFETFEGSIWNDVVGSAKTLTVPILTDNVTLNNDEIWLEVDYLGTAGAPISTRMTTEPARLIAGTAVPSDTTTTWTTTGLTTPVKQKLSVTFTPQLKGPVRWRVKYAKSGANSNVCYISPPMSLT